MNIFYIMLFITFGLSIVSIIKKNKYGKPNLLITIALMIIFTVISGIRSGFGDTWAYIYSYNRIGPNYNFVNSGYEIGFTFFLMLLKKISTNPQFMIFITSSIINISNIFIIRKYSKNSFELSIFLYMTAYYLVTMNGIRQSLVASLIFLCTPLLIKRKFYIYALIIILLSTFHVSALIMIPVYFVCNKKAWGKEIWIWIILFIIAMIFYEPFINILYEILGDSKYANYKNFNEGGANIIRVLVYFVPVVISYIKRKQLEDWVYGDIFVNITLLNFVIMAFSYYNWIFARFSIYTQLYVIVLVPYIIKNCFNKNKEYKLMYYGFIVCYLLFFIYDCRISNVIYYTNLNIISLFYN